MLERDVSRVGDTAVLVGDACLFTGASFCVLAVVGGPLALLVGPALAWVLHGRRPDSHSIISGLIGLVVAIALVGGLLAGVPALINAIAPPVAGAEDYSGALTLLLAVAALFGSLALVLDVGAIRDLMPARRMHARLDVARLVATAAIVAFGAIITVAQMMNPATQIGDAGVFALAAAAVGAVTMLVGNAVASHPAKNHGDAGSASGA